MNYEVDFWMKDNGLLITKHGLLNVNRCGYLNGGMERSGEGEGTNTKAEFGGGMARKIYFSNSLK